MQTTIINAIAPTRICDVGGWTDTHFARYGAVFNIAIYPAVEVQVHLLSTQQTQPQVIINVENYGDSYTLNPNRIVYDKHPLIEATIKTMRLSSQTALKINIFSHVPPGASIGTSAALTVALVGALQAISKEELLRYNIATLAHSIETKELGLECGIQDQLASAYGGINLFEIEDFPRTRVFNLTIADSIQWELEQRLLLVYIGKPHFSSAVHKQVIASLGKEPHTDSRLVQLRQLAYQARDALTAKKFIQLGEIFNTNTQVQRELHPSLVNDNFETIIALAKTFDALGCKVNGAGGDGGSLTILTNGDMNQKRLLQQAIINQGWQIIPLQLAHDGIRIWKNVYTK